mmetsp:Transcript_11010/g.24288  ORF Transcript_11010/g.24288 Transcript_11010/m.24288 type:complete len:305 (-) Transcript_11010:379-1293(-)|eukprot:CAMPEP_0172323802 /NCGR_PEP_ID=MMETSP1058-20130122/49627_1 /TAXON_ID=83371 /ORGANISM="Detonula confervacea, Strain CCMP 353" /LENGTH=304 /DNA_ID=CAMNT_0013039899 /DNA_START=207 /DNA_END=1121 /DNA_ORIENTATION=+
MNSTDKDNSCCAVIKRDDDDVSIVDYQAYPPAPPRPTSSTTPTSDGPLNYSSNILLVYRLHEMRHMENVNFSLAIACLVYCGINIALIVTNYVNSHNEDDPPVSEQSFHVLEFWGTFLFAVVECISLTSTPKSILNIYNNPHALRLILFFNIVAASLPAILVTLNYEYFEIISHQIEYLNELTMSFVDLVLLWSLCQYEGTSLMLAGIASIVAVVQLAVYNGMGKTESGDMVGEVPAHYLEFTFGIISSLIAFWFCMDNKIMCGKEIGEILYGTHNQCNICVDNSNEFSETYLNKSRLNRYGSV